MDGPNSPVALTFIFTIHTDASTLQSRIYIGDTCWHSKSKLINITFKQSKRQLTYVGL